MALFHLDKKTMPSSAHFAADEVFTTLVADAGGGFSNDRLGVDTPRGALGGMVATLSGADNTVNICDEALTPDYLFYNDAQSAPFDNAPNVASGKVALLPLGNGDYIEVDVYETHDVGDTDITANYVIGALLYSSERGLLTNVDTGGQTAVGRVAKVPTTDDPRLGLRVL